MGNFADEIAHSEWLAERPDADGDMEFVPSRGWVCPDCSNTSYECATCTPPF